MMRVSAIRVILASASPRRSDLLNLAGIRHDVRPADVDESHAGSESPAEHAERLARMKAGSIAAGAPDALVIGSDTIVVIDESVLGKPRDTDDASRMLRLLSGRTHRVITAVAVQYGGNVRAAVEPVDVTFRDLTDAEIASYVETGEPMDKAGAYGIQGYGATIVQRIDGDYFAVMGLSLVRLVDLMRQLGVLYDFGR